MKKSLIIIKPDMERNIEAQKKLYDLLIESELTVYKTSKITFDDLIIQCMWPQFTNDIVSMRILSNYLNQAELEVLYVSGMDAISKTTRIKKRIRKSFSQSPFQSCLHTPVTSEEYYKNLDIINGVANVEHYPIKEVPPFIPLQESGYTYDELISTADQLWQMLNKDKESFFKKSDSLLNNKKFSLLLKDCRHEHYDISIEYVVATILRKYPDFKIVTVYLSVMVAIMKGKAILHSSDNVHFLREMSEYLSSKYIECEIE